MGRRAAWGRRRSRPHVNVDHLSCFHVTSRPFFLLRPFAELATLVIQRRLRLALDPPPAFWRRRCRCQIF